MNVIIETFLDYKSKKNLEVNLMLDESGHNHLTAG